MQERRTEPRMLCADVVEVWWTDPEGQITSMTGLLEDISPSGACLQLDRAAPLGAELHWKSRRKQFTGRVRYCLYREIGYFIGVEFAHGSKWSSKSYRPQHLLNLENLLG